MRWLPTIFCTSFSSFPSTSPSSSCSDSSSAFSPEKHRKDRKSLSHNDENRRSHRHNHLGLRNFSPRLSLPRRARHQTDKELVAGKSVEEVEDPEALSRSASICDHTSNLTVSVQKSPPSLNSVPLPLPLPVPEADGDQRNLSPKRDGDKPECEAASAPLTPVASAFAARDSRKTKECGDSRSSPRVACQDLNCDSNSRHEFPIFRVSSGPGSPMHCMMSSGPGSPLHPMMSSGPGSPLHPMMSSGPGSPLHPMMSSGPGSPLHPMMSTGPGSPLHPMMSTGPGSPLHPMMPSRPASPLHLKLSIEIPSTRHDGGPISGHRLPLPPGAALPSPSSTLSQESLPMNCQWQKGKLIGRGTFGSVYVASNRETGALCAMKEVEIFPDDPKCAECVQQLEQEIKVLSQLKHPNIVQYYGSEIVEDRFHIYLEYVHPGSINRYIQEHCGAMTESVVRNFTRHILCGLAYLHSTKTIHRDIKGANLLVDPLGFVKLADFGMSKHLTGQRADLSLKGSPYWMAPELMQAVLQKDNSSDQALAVDIWSLGCTIIEMFTGKPPWSEYQGAAALFKVMKDTPPVPDALSPEGKDFLRCCFQRNPAARPTASMLLEHRFLQNPQHSGLLSPPTMKSMDLPLSPG